MRRPFFAAFLALVGLTFSLPDAWAAARVGVQDADIVNAAGEPLRCVPHNKLVYVRVTLVNSGDANATEQVRVSLHFFMDDRSFDRTDPWTVSVNQLAPGQTVTQDYSWQPPVKGEANVEVFLESNSTVKQAREFLVTENECLRLSLAEAGLVYSWFYAAFLAAVLLFVAVVRARKPGP